MGMRLTISALLAAAGIAQLTGCSTTSAPAEKTVFLKNPKLLKHYDLVPFHKVWKKEGVDLRKYTKIIIEPVVTTQSLPKDDLEALNIEAVLGTEKQAILDFAKYTREAFEKAVVEDPRLSLAKSPGPNTLIIKLALVKVVPGKPLFGIVRNIPLPIGKAAFIVSPALKLTGATVDASKGSVAIEGELLDSQTRQPIAMFADRRTERKAIVNVNSMSSFGTPKAIVNEWARLLVKCLGRKPGEKIPRDESFKLIQF